MKQLIVIADMEGASGIFDLNKEACWHEELYKQKTLWRTYGRACITSDVLAVCNAAIDMGIDDILLYDMHFAGCNESNIELEKLPSKVRLFDLPNREIWWGRIRGQAMTEPYGIVTVGQHARNGEANAYFPHTIHTPPIKEFFINGIHVAEIGESVMCFSGVPYIANIGCAASHKEALELSNYAFRVANNTQKFIAIDLKNPTKGLDEIEEKTQARARLRIKNLRLENNKSQKELAKYLEIDLSTYNKYEKGSRKLSNEVVKKLAEYYNVSVSDIVD